MAAVQEDSFSPDPDGEEAEPLPAAFSEDALAVVWVKRHGKDWRYVTPWNAWYQWTGDHWAHDKTQAAFDLARNITREVLIWPECTKAIGTRVNSARTAGSLLQFVKADRAIAASTDQWDKDPMLLGVPGGVLDLKTCKLSKAERAHFITKRAAISPQEGEPQRWLEFLERVTNGNRDLQGYLQRFCGYCLTGKTDEHAMAFLYGTGANGKTTLVQTVLGILGEYALTTPIETFSETKAERHPTELARLRGARLVATEETNIGSRWNEGRIKTLTGGNRISAHFMRQDDFEFQPEFKLLIAGNHQPQMRSVDEAMKRRVHIVPFTVTIPEEERDPNLQDALKAEWPQIFNWMLQGCAAWRDYRLAPPEDVRNATERYLRSNDILGTWIEDRCEQNGWDIGKDLYNDFVNWCEDQGETIWKRRGWADAMVSSGFNPGKQNGIRGFHGLKLRHRSINTVSTAQNYNN